MAKTNRTYRLGRRKRIRDKINGTADRPRLSVFRSLKHVYAQIIDDTQGMTLAFASSLDPSIVSKKGGAKSDQSRSVGTILAERAKAAGIQQVVFDRGGNKYHGRVKALADAARKGGLKF